MKDKLLEFIKQYCNGVEKSIKAVGKAKTIAAALDLIIKRENFTSDELRKEISLYVKRIISEKEFEQILNYDRAEYALLFYE